MTTIKAVVRNGRIETVEPLELPDGTELRIPVPSPVDDSDWDNSPEGIAAWLEWADSLEPLVFTDAERAAWEDDEQARKDWEKARFHQYTAS